MQKSIMFICLIAASFSSYSQKIDLTKFEKERINIQKKSMVALAGWSVANIVVSSNATNNYIGNRPAGQCNH